MMKLLGMALGGAIGTLLRYATSGAIGRWSNPLFPWGTLTVNLAGSFCIGFLWMLFEATVVSSNLRSFLLIGLLGGFTTFSTFSIETFHLIRDGEKKLALLNLLLSNIGGLLCVVAGYSAAKLFLIIPKLNNVQ
jgi:CrcB protein